MGRRLTPSARLVPYRHRNPMPSPFTTASYSPSRASSVRNGTGTSPVRANMRSTTRCVDDPRARKINGSRRSCSALTLSPVASGWPKGAIATTALRASPARRNRRSGGTSGSTPISTSWVSTARVIFSCEPVSIRISTPG